MSAQTMKCRRCGETLKRLALQALMTDTGAKMDDGTGWPIFCHDGEDHDFSSAEEVIEAGDR